MTLGYIQDILLARDLWMHRDDVCQALGRSFDPGPYAEESSRRSCTTWTRCRSGVSGRPSYWSSPDRAVGPTGWGGASRSAAPPWMPSSYMRTLSGRDDDPAVSGDPLAVEAVAGCRMPF